VLTRVLRRRCCFQLPQLPELVPLRRLRVQLLLLPHLRLWQQYQWLLKELVPPR